ncbi:Uncharacterized oxidoreductase SAV2478 [Listeria grayi]|uniref:Uncharacterized oxidoreductase SAV2478 n=1 Tax=Listeria grayi TaxID=1641 RepID=A0A378MEV9_LISGR|nr:oxidoreductase [Listeria grayi]STY44344.1 Uncharacterized oxidoreductase SAV2478 [Listeria grayi]
MSNEQVWFITGASRGFGRALVEDLLQRGDKVVATMRKTENISFHTSSENLLILPLDVTDEMQSKEAAKKAVDYFGRIDVLVNNAGFGVMGAIEEIADIEARKTYDTNVFGLLNVTRAVLPYLRKERSGHIMNISSVGGLVGLSAWGIYGSTKFAVEGISEALSHEVTHLGIKVTSVAPGFFRTDFLDDSSLDTAPTQIADYNESVGQVRVAMKETNHNQPGDPIKAAKVMIDVAKTEHPPLHLMLGSDTLEYTRTKIEALVADMEDWKAYSESTDL